MEDTNKRFWERMAKLYGPIQEKSNRLLYEETARHCAAYLNSTGRVLEIACGSGQLTRPLYPLAGTWEATDFSEKMIAELKKRCPGVSASVQDAADLPYADGSFDVVLAANVLHIMPEPERALAEIRRVLTDGGILLAPTFVYEGKVNRFRMAVTQMLGFRTYAHWTLAELADFLSQAGLTPVETALLPGSPLPEGFAAARKEPSADADQSR